MEPTITKRLHISGLTPAISEQDLVQRLSTFGNLRSLDGLGLTDANGQPRRFAYATLEATPAKLSKCLTTLSGSTWKGTKLRIGEAKPDFRERIQRENQKAAEEAAEPPRKKPRWKYAPYHAFEAKDLAPITLEQAKLKAGWVVTPLGRAYRPLRLRPSRPLPPLAATTLPMANGKGKEKLKFKRQRKMPDGRARIRKIDMMKYGSIYMKGKFLDPDVFSEADLGRSLKNAYVTPMEGSDEESEEDWETSDESEPEREREYGKGIKAGKNDGNDVAGPVQVAAAHESSPSAALQPSSLPIQPPAAQQLAPMVVDFDSEKHHSLNILASIFGSVGNVDESDEDDWMAKESLDSDHLSRSGRPDEGDIDFEVVPRRSGKKERPERVRDDEPSENGPNTSMAIDEESYSICESAFEKQTVQEPIQPQKKLQQKAPTKLKNLFAPAETEVFSLLGHLNLNDDFDLDESLAFPPYNDVEHSAISEQPISTPATTPKDRSQNVHHTSRITLDPSKPLFFPLALLSSHPSFASSSFPTSPNAKNRPKDLFDVLEAEGSDWRTAKFYRTETEDEIRKRWEEQKGELTVGWKKRWREAKRAGRRRGKGSGGDEGF